MSEQSVSTPAMPVEFHMAAIEHGYGVNFYADLTPEGLVKRINEYVTEWWSDEMLDDEGDVIPMPEDMEEARASYFANGQSGEHIVFSKETIDLAMIIKIIAKSPQALAYLMQGDIELAIGTLSQALQSFTLSQLMGINSTGESLEGSD